MRKIISEQIFPYTLGIILGVSWIIFQHNGVLPEKTEALISAMINVYAVAIGFLATALALLFAIDDRSVIKFLRKNHLYRRFIRFFFEAIIFCSIALIYSASLIIHDFKPNGILTKILVAGWFTVSSISALTCLRVFWLLFITLHKQIEEDEDNL